MDQRGRVTGMQEVAATDLRINGGYFMFRRPVLDEIQPGEDLVPDVFPRLIERGEVMAFRYDGFWAPMDTLRDWQKLEGFVARGDLPWAVWRPRPDVDESSMAAHVDIAPASTTAPQATTTPDGEPVPSGTRRDPIAS
jgi:glucose-1-phosphate cytidylyltransferase